MTVTAVYRYCTGRGRAFYKHVPGWARTLKEGALLQMYVTKSVYKSQQRTVLFKYSVAQRMHVCSSSGSSVSAHLIARSYYVLVSRKPLISNHIAVFRIVLYPF
jgi:hypothetical protein